MFKGGLLHVGFPMELELTQMELMQMEFMTNSLETPTCLDAFQRKRLIGCSVDGLRLLKLTPPLAVSLKSSFLGGGWPKQWGEDCALQLLVVGLLLGPCGKENAGLKGLGANPVHSKKSPRAVSDGFWAVGLLALFPRKRTAAGDPTEKPGMKGWQESVTAGVLQQRPFPPPVLAGCCFPGKSKEDTKGLLWLRTSHFLPANARAPGSVRTQPPVKGERKTEIGRKSPSVLRLMGVADLRSQVCLGQVRGKVETNGVCSGQSG